MSKFSDWSQSLFGIVSGAFLAKSENARAEEQWCQPCDPHELGADQQSVGTRAEQAHQLWLDRLAHSLNNNSLWSRNMGHARSMYSASMAYWRGDAPAVYTRDSGSRFQMATANSVRLRLSSNRMPSLHFSPQSFQINLPSTKSPAESQALVSHEYLPPSEKPMSWSNDSLLSEKTINSISEQQTKTINAVSESFHLEPSVDLDLLLTSDEQFEPPSLLDDQVAKAVDAISDSPQCDALFSDNFDIEPKPDQESELPLVTYEKLIEIRMATADHPDSSEVTIRRLAQDPNPDVRYAVAENANINEVILKELLSDQNPYVAERARKTIQRITVSPVLKGHFGVFQQKYFARGSNNLLH